MGSKEAMDAAKTKPHAVCVPFPAQGHINPMVKLAKLLHSRGFHITFVNTEYNHRRLLKARGPSALDDLPDFRFRTIPDGLPPSDAGEGVTQHVPSLCESIDNNCLPYFRDLLASMKEEAETDDRVPPVSFIVSDGVMTFTLDAAEELGVPEVLFWTTSACGYWAYTHYKEIAEKGLLPLPDDQDTKLMSRYLDRPISWIPGMPRLRLRDLPTFIRTSSAENALVFRYVVRETHRASKATAIVLHTFEELERPVLDAMSSYLSPPVYTIGPLSRLCEQLPPEYPVATLGSNLWKEDNSCLAWLDGRPSGSVVYVNFGSVTVMSHQQLVEFAGGLADSGHDFLWIIRPDLVRDDSAVVPPGFVEKTRGRGVLAGWCPQEAVLAHPAVGGFLTHTGWNSTLESICCGVPMLCWPFFAEQQTNCRYVCAEWGIGKEIDNDVKRDEVAALIKNLMSGKDGAEMRKAAMAWKERAEKAVEAGGTSSTNMENLVKVLLSSSRPSPTS